jgi:hypothetical protein
MTDARTLLNALRNDMQSLRSSPNSDVDDMAFSERLLAAILVLEASQARILQLGVALTDSNAALSTFVDLTKYTREPYETPLSAHDRARDILEALKPKP